MALEKKQQAWQWILDNHQPEKIQHLVREISLAEAPQALQNLLAGGIQGRCLVNIDA